MKELKNKYVTLPSVGKLSKPQILERYHASIKSQANIFLLSDLKNCTFNQELYDQYKTLGVRENYEAKYNQSRDALMWLSLGSCIDASAYSSKLIEVIQSILREPTWVLPAHANYVPRKPDDPQYNNMDWAAAQTAAWLGFAVISGVLDDALKSEIVLEINTRVFDIFTSTDLVRRQVWFGDKTISNKRSVNNLTAWTTTNTLFAASCILDGEDLNKVADYAALIYDRFLADCTEDGFCREGATYWSAGIGSYIDGLVLLDKISQGKINVFDDEFFAKTMRFPLSMTIEGEKTFCLSDSRSGGRPQYPWFLSIIDALERAGHNLNSVKTWASNGLRGAKPEATRCADVRFACRSYNLLCCDYTTKMGTLSEKNDYYPDAQIKVMREYPDRLKSRGFTALFKGGNNAEGGHNHNDVGEVILYNNGIPILLDLGIGIYTKRSFDPLHRYTLINHMSNFHNCAKVGDFYQQAGEEYFSSVIDENENSMTLDLAFAYPPEANINAYTRKTELVNGEVVIEDKLNVSEATEVKYVWVTCAKPIEVEPGKMKLNGVVFEYDQRLTPDIEEITLDVYETSRLYGSNGVRELFRVRLCGSLETGTENTHKVLLYKE